MPHIWLHQPGSGGGGGPHAATHLPGGSDPIDWSGTIHQIGTLAGRPAAASTNTGTLYFATDAGGAAGQGVLYRSDGVSVWEAVAIDKEYADALYLAANAPAGGDLSGTYPNPTVNDGADSTAIHDNLAGEIAAVTEKTSPVAADLLLIEDSAAANAKKRVQIGNLPGAGHTIRDVGVDLPARTGLNFFDGLKAADDAVNDESEVSLAINELTQTAGAQTNDKVAVWSPVEVGHRKIDLSALAAGLNLIDVQEFTSGANTWTKPADAKVALVILVGAGGGGAGGYRNVSGTDRVGGGGGMGGEYLVTAVDAADLGATETVTVGAGGAGGAGATTNGAGASGTAGGDTTMTTQIAGVTLTAKGGRAGAHGFFPGTGGGRSTGTGSNIPFNDAAGGAGRGGSGAEWRGSGGTGDTIVKSGGNGWTGGGGGGANITTSDATKAAIAGGDGQVGAGGAAGAPGGAGGAGSKWFGGGGGGGGNTGANGGNGGTPGGGGGGGGAATDPTTAGSGGSGGDGYAVVFTFR